MGNEKSGLMDCGLTREAHEQEAGEGEARRAGAGPGAGVVGCMARSLADTERSLSEPPGL